MWKLLGGEVLTFERSGSLSAIVAFAGMSDDWCLNVG